MFSNFLSKTVRFVKSMKANPATQHFMQHCKRVFAPNGKGGRGGPTVLIELNEMHSAHIAYSYLANVLAMEHDAEIHAYFPQAHANTRERVLFRIRKLLGANTFGVYGSFGVTDFITIDTTAAQKRRAKTLAEEVLGSLSNKWDIEAITINGVWIGDLIYDTYLKRVRKPTIDMMANDFQEFLLESLELFVFWEDYLNNHDVKAINVSHCVYNLAMPLRMAVARNIAVYQANVSEVYRLNKDNLFAYNDFHHIRDRFASLPESVKMDGIEEAKRRIQRRFSGEVGVDMAYSTKSAYSAQSHTRLLKVSSKKKILVATHCFFDSPHSYGNNIFPDFYDWLDFLGQMTLLTDYDWYVKTHPDYLPGTKEVIDEFIAKYPKLTLLPANASHHQIISEGIDVALTVYGTIAFEYAALGVLVINCSLNNPHIAFDFNMHPRDVEEYREMLLSLNTLEFHPNRQQVYEYYFMVNVYDTDNLFFDSSERAIKLLGGYSAQFTEEAYMKWLNEWSLEKHLRIRASITNFIKSGDFRMDSRHLKIGVSSDMVA